MYRPAALIGLLLASLGCTASTPTRAGEPAVGGPLEKADSIDICALYELYGDGYCDGRCAAADPDCDGCSPVLCELYCPGGFERDDRGCAVCGCAEALEEGECSGSMNAACEDGEYCDYGDDSCGFGELVGNCERSPGRCTREFRPVCGCDGNTYSNSCNAKAAGVDVASVGPCEEPECPPVLCELFCEFGFATGPDGCAICSCAEPRECGARAGDTCGDDEYCDWEPDSCGATDATGLCKTRPEICTRELRPVCGCDGNTYGNSCSAHAAGVDSMSAGACEEPDEPGCPPVLCELFCVNGFDTGPDGCPVCRCR